MWGERYSHDVGHEPSTYSSDVKGMEYHLPKFSCLDFLRPDRLWYHLPHYSMRSFHTSSRSILSLTALQQQIIAIFSILDEYSGRISVSEQMLVRIVDAVTDRKSISEQDIAAALRDLGRQGFLMRFAGDVNGTYRSATLPASDISACRRGAAAVYGAIDPAHLPDDVTGLNRVGMVGNGKERFFFLARYLNYLLDIGIVAPAAAALDEMAATVNGGNASDGSEIGDYIGFAQRLWEITRQTSTDIPESLREVLLPFSLAEAFFSDGPVEPLLERAVEAASRHAALQGITANRIAPLCVWTGRLDLLERYAPLAGKRGEPSIALARMFFGKGPTKIVPKPLDYVGAMYRDIQTTLVGLLAAKFPPPPVRLLEALEALCHNTRSPALAEFMRGALAPSPEPDDSWRKTLPQSVRQAAQSRKPSPPMSAIAWLGRTMQHALSTDPAKRTSFPEALQALRAAETAEAAGLHFLASQLGGLLAQWPETSEQGIALAAKVPQDMPLLWNRTEIAHPWDPLLEELGKAIAPLAKAKKPRAAKKVEGAVLLAMPELSSLDPDDLPKRIGGDPFKVPAIGLAIVKPRRDGSIPTPEKPSTFRAIRKAFLERSVELPDAAFEAIEQVFRHELPGFKSDASAASIRNTREDLLDIILGLRGTAVFRLSLPKAGKNGAMDAEIIDEPAVEVANITLKTEWTPDGALRLSLPSVAWIAENDPVFVRTDLGRFTWHRLPSTLRPFLDLLRSQGARSVVVIPKGGAEKARGMLLDAAAAGLPVEGAITPAGDAAALKAVAGAARVVVRLELRDGVLSAQLRARPVAKEPDLLFEPGRGRREVPVPSLKEPFLLRRDLNGEKSAADGIRAALADFAGEAEDDCAWSIEDIARQLALLEALRDAVAANPDRVSLEWRSANRIEIRFVNAAAIEGVKGADWWLGVEGEFRFDNGSAAALGDLIAALPRRVGGYVPLDGGSWLRLTSSLRRRLEALASAGTLDGSTLRMSPAALPMLEQVFAEAPEGAESNSPFTLRLPEELEHLADEFHDAMAAEHPVPEGLVARLRPYQVEGFEWLARLASCGLGACLADDMGLGKTVQLIALLLERAADGASLVVAPASVCGNWCAELARFAPGLYAVRAGDTATLPDVLGPGGVVITSYGLLVSREAQFAAVEWNVAILDEAQAVKNADAKRAQAVKRLHARCRFVATGTPVENRLSDLWSLFDFLNPGLLGTLDSFRHRLLDVDGRPRPALKALVRPLILRRLKGEVLRDLPPKTEITLDVELGEAERAAYETLREEAVAELQTGGRGRTDGQRRIQILAALTRLRRFCCAPGLVLPGFGTGAKLEALEALLDDLRANGHRALVFSQFVDVLSLVRPVLERHRWGYEYLDGSTPQAERTRRVEAFQRGSAPFFLVSLKAGGTGLNLTAANYVVLLDPWWNPAVEDQAADRAHRIGQANPVTVYRLVTRGTIEEKVVALHGDKRELSSAVLEGTGDATVSAADLLALFRKE